MAQKEPICNQFFLKIAQMGTENVNNLLFYSIIQAISGMDNNARNVVRNVPCAMTVSSFPYFRQKMVPNDATGIAISSVLIAIDVSLKCTPGTRLIA